jgi:protein gp37
MASQSKIEWTGSTWNPVTGCTKISKGCLNCYAERMARRLQAMGQNNYRNGFEVTCHEHVLSVPRNLRKPQMIFVNSMSDLFHRRVPTKFIKKIFGSMLTADHHTYQVLTKRAERLEELSNYLEWQPHIWMGVTVESADYKFRIGCLRRTNAHVKFLSCEPLLGSLGKLDLQGIDWVIVGGESGPGARPIKEEWIIEVRDQCVKAGVPFFFKQWGGVNKKKTGRLLEGRVWNEVPEREEVFV